MLILTDEQLDWPLERIADRRWTIERTISWLPNFRRPGIRWAESTQLFSGFLHLGGTLLSLKEVLG